MTREVIINLHDIYLESISNRSSISVILEKYKTQENLDLVLNFNEIKFCSRSAAQQLVLEKKELAKRNIRVFSRNVSFDVNKILELAEYKLVRHKLEVTVRDEIDQDEYESILANI